jgi:hypothetical protein
MTALRLARALLRDADFRLFIAACAGAYVLAAGLACLMEI